MEVTLTDLTAIASQLERGAAFCTAVCQARGLRLSFLASRLSEWKPPSGHPNQ